MRWPASTTSGTLCWRGRTKPKESDSNLVAKRWQRHCCSMAPLLPTWTRSSRATSLSTTLSPGIVTQAKKAGIFGEGIYFSEMPAVSLMYGNGLLLCKVVLGDCETVRPLPGTAKQPDIPEQFDSRKVLAGDGSGVIHVVKRPSQVLPYCVVNLKNESLSSDFRKPALKPVSPVIMAQH